MKPIKPMKPTLDKKTPVPLYFQLKNYLLEKIESKELKPGDSLLSERELSEQFSISRMTVRQALKELVNEGLLIREQGKGTFVAEPKIKQGLLRLTSFSEDMIRLGKVPSAYVVSCEVKRQPSANLIEALQFAAPEPVLVLTRVRLADERPIALETTHLPLLRFPQLEYRPFEGVSLYRLLEEEYGVIPASASQTIEAGIPYPHEIHELQLNPEIPVLLIHRVTFDQNRVPYEYVKSVYAGDRYKFQADLVR